MSELRIKCAKFLGWEFDCGDFPENYHTPRWYKNGEGIPSRLPGYGIDANALREIYEVLNTDLELRVAWLNRLHTLLEPDAPKNKMGNPVVSDYMKITAAPSLQCQ